MIVIGIGGCPLLDTAISTDAIGPLVPAAALICIRCGWCVSDDVPKSPNSTTQAAGSEEHWWERVGRELGF